MTAENSAGDADVYKEPQLIGVEKQTCHLGYVTITESQWKS